MCPLPPIPRKKNDMLHYLEDFHKVAYQLSGVMKVLSLFCWQWLTCIFPRKKISVTVMWGSSSTMPRILLLLFFFWWKRYHWLRGEKTKPCQKYVEGKMITAVYKMWTSESSKFLFNRRGPHQEIPNG